MAALAFPLSTAEARDQDCPQRAIREAKRTPAKMFENETKLVVKKKASFIIERLKPKRKRSLDTNLSTERLMPSSRITYQPQHAASDFSKVTVSQHDPPLDSIAAVGSRSIGTRSIHPGPSPAPAPNATPDELQSEEKKGELNPPSPRRPPRCAQKPSRDFMFPPRRTHSSPRARRRPQIIRQQPEQSVESVKGLMGDATFMKPSFQSKRTTETPTKPDGPVQRVGAPPSCPPFELPSGQVKLSDFEMFMAKAEAVDRAQRKAAWKAIAALQQNSFGSPWVVPNPQSQGADRIPLIAACKQAGDGTQTGAALPAICQRSSGRPTNELVEETRRAQARLKALLAKGGLRNHDIGKREQKVVVAVREVDDKVQPVIPATVEQHTATPRQQSGFAKRLVEYIRPPREEKKLGQSGRKLTFRRATTSQGD